MVIVDEIADWVNKTNKKELDAGFYKIFTFYVLNTPCVELSGKAIPLSQYGWNNPWGKPSLLNRRLKEATSKSIIVFSSENYDKMESSLKQSNLFEIFPPLDMTTERVCIHNNKKNQFMSIFYHLRNALAHGRFNVTDESDSEVFVLEDVVPCKGKGTKKISARMVLQKSTLLRWIDIIQNKEEAITDLK